MASGPSPWTTSPSLAEPRTTHRHSVSNQVKRNEIDFMSVYVRGACPPLGEHEARSATVLESVDMAGHELHAPSKLAVQVVDKRGTVCMYPSQRFVSIADHQTFRAVFALDLEDHELQHVHLKAYATTPDAEVVQWDDLDDFVYTSLALVKSSGQIEPNVIRVVGEA